MEVNFEDEELQIEEVTLDDKKEEQKYSCEFELSGVRLQEEVKFIQTLCDKEESEDSIPLFVKYGATRVMAGFFNPTIDNILKLHVIDKNYILSFRDNVHEKELNIFDENLIGENLTKFLSLRL